MRSETTKKNFKRCPNRFNGINESFTESKSFYSAKRPILPSFLRGHLESNLVLSSEEKEFRVDDFCVSEKNGIAAEEGFWLVGGDEYLKLKARQLYVLKGNLLEAFSFIGGFWICWRNISGESW